MDYIPHVIVGANGRLHRSRKGKELYRGIGAARAALTRLIKDGVLDARARVITRREYLAQRQMVTVTNLVTGKPVRIPEDEVGGPCDPSTNRYHEM